MTPNTFLSITLASLVAGQNLNAVTFTWDPLLTASGSDGAGEWDNVSANWAWDIANTAMPASAQTTITVALVIGANSITVANSAGIAEGQVLSTDCFPVGTTVTGIAGNVVSLSQSATKALAVANTIVFSLNSDAVIGSGTDTAGTVNVTGYQALDSLVLNSAASENYWITGGSIAVSGRNGSTGMLKVNADTSIGSALSWRNIQFQTEGKTLTLTGGGITGNPIGTFNGSVSGFNAAMALASTLEVSGGIYASGGAGNTINIGNQVAETGGLRFSAGTFNCGGSFQIGNDRTAYGEITGSAILNSSGQISVGRNGGNIAKFVIDGGTVNSNATSQVDAQIEIGRSNGKGTLDVRNGIFKVIGNGVTGNSGGIMVINTSGTAAGAGGTIRISGGTVTAKELRFNGSNKNAGAVSGGDVNSTIGSANLNMTGGEFYIGGTVQLDGTGATTAGGIVNRGTGTSTYAVDLSGGTIGANANWSSNLNMTLGTTNGNITFKAANAVDAAFNIALSGVLSGPGGLSKTGAGLLALSGANSYAGDTVVLAGTLALTGSGAIPDSPVIDVRSGATLDVSGLSTTFALAGGKTLTGEGSVTGPITAAGTIAPGNGAGTLTTGAANLTGTLAVEVDGTGADKLVSTGTLNISGASLAVSLLPGGFTEPSYVIAEGSSLTGTFAGVPSGYSVSYTATQAILTQSSGGNYASWANTHGIPGEPASGDFDRDGFTNLVEYALGLDPAAASGAPGVLANGILSFTKGAAAVANGDVTYAIEESTTLGDDPDPWAVVTPAVNDGSTISYQLSAGMPKEFVRLKVTQAP